MRQILDVLGDSLLMRSVAVAVRLTKVLDSILPWSPRLWFHHILWRHWLSVEKCLIASACETLARYQLDLRKVPLAERAAARRIRWIGAPQAGEEDRGRERDVGLQNYRGET